MLSDARTAGAAKLANTAGSTLAAEFAKIAGSVSASDALATEIRPTEAASFAMDADRLAREAKSAFASSLSPITASFALDRDHLNRAQDALATSLKPIGAIDNHVGKLTEMGVASQTLGAASASATLAAEVKRHLGSITDLNPAYRSAARDVLDQIGAAHRDITPSNLERVATKPVETPPQAMAIISAADIGRRVRKARRAMGMTQQHFADLAGVGRRFLIELEKGKPTLEIGRVLAVCQAAGIRIGFLP